MFRGWSGGIAVPLIGLMLHGITRAPCAAVSMHEIGKHYAGLEGRGTGHAFPVKASR